MPTAEHRKFLSELPKDWEKVPISALGEVHAGSTPRRSNPQYWNGSIAWVTPGELTDLGDKWLTETEDFITEAGLSSSSTKLMPPGTLLVTTRATIGNIAIATIPITTNQGFKNIVPNDTTEPEFYYYMLQLIIPEMQRLASGSTFREISGRNFSSIIVPRPSVAEQRRIADILDTADAAIRETEAVIAKLKQVKAGLLHDLLTRGLDENGRLRDPQRHPEQFKETAIGRVPTEWRVVELQDLSDDPITYGVLKPGPYVENGIPLLQIQDVIHGQINRDKLHRISAKLDNQYARTRIVGGEIVMSLVGTIGRVAQIPNWLAGANLHRNLARIEIKANHSTRFIYHYLQSEIAKHAIEARRFGSTQSLLNLSTLRSLPVCSPPLDEQRSITTALDEQEKRIRIEEVYRDKLQQVKRGLMQDLLTGRVRV